MSRISPSQYLLWTIQKIAGLFSPVWENRLSAIQSKFQHKTNDIEGFAEPFIRQENGFSLSGSNCSSHSAKLNSNKGFASILMLTALPVLLAALMFFAYSSFLVKNWMQSLHICRSGLIQTQKEVALDLEALLRLNPVAQTLRLRLKMAYVKLAAAIASQNWGLAAQARIEIAQIKAQQKKLDLAQKLLIQKANLRMKMGSFRAYQELRSQNAFIAQRLPWFFSYSIQAQMPRPNVLAVKPDTPEMAPVYELKNAFERLQALSVSWSSRFASGEQKDMKWISNKHIRKDFCSITLSSKDNPTFYPQMIEDKW